MRSSIKWVVVIVPVLALAACSAKTTSVSSPSASSPVPHAASAAPSSATPKATKAASSTVTYVVTGTPGATVTYGPAGSSFTGSVPLCKTVTIPSTAPLYYSLQVQLQGGGQVTCQILVDGKVISSSTAQGGYNLAMCEIGQDPVTGKWQSENACCAVCPLISVRLGRFAALKHLLSSLTLIAVAGGSDFGRGPMRVSSIWRYEA